MPLPLLIQCRNNQFIRDLILTLRKVGVDCNALATDKRDFVLRVERERKRVMILWAGPWRRKSSDLHPPSPYTLFAEHAYGLQHYESIGFDARGHGRHASLPFLRPTITDQARDLYRAWCAKHISEPRVSPGVTRGLPDPPYVFFPLQLPRDTVIQYDSPLYCQDRTNLIKQVAACLPAGLSLVVKQHPKDTQPVVFPNQTKGAVKLLQIPVGDRNTAANHHLFLNCECVLTINSSMAIEALYYEKPLLTLGKGIFTGNNVGYEVPCLDPSLFDDPKRHWNAAAAEALLAELCVYRQIHNADVRDQDVVLRVFGRLNQVYRRMWDEDFLPADLAEAAAQL